MDIRQIQVIEYDERRNVESGGGIHPFHEILALMDGKVTLYWMGNVYEAEAPALFLLPSNTPHLLISQTNCCKYGYIELDTLQWAAQFPGMAQSTAWNELQPSLPASVGKYATILRVNAQIWESYSVEPAYQPIACQLVVHDVCKLLLLIRHYLQQTAAAEALGAKGRAQSMEIIDRLKPIVRYMESKYQDPLSIAELAAKANMEQNHFIRSFTKLSGCTPLQYLQNLRLSAACSYLSTTPIPIHNIAELCGFQSIHYFSRLFKQHYNVNPTAWRKLHQPGRERLTKHNAAAIPKPAAFYSRFTEE